MSVFVTFLAEGEKHAIFTYQKFKVFALAQSNREMRWWEGGQYGEKKLEVPLKNVG